MYRGEGVNANGFLSDDSNDVTVGWPNEGAVHDGARRRWLKKRTSTSDGYDALGGHAVQLLLLLARATPQGGDLLHNLMRSLVRLLS